MLILGGSASGKTSVCSAIVNSLQLPWVDLLSMDRYYKVLSPEEQALAKEGLYNFDHPNAFDSDRLYEDLVQIKAGNPIEVPNYDFSTHARTAQTDPICDVDIILVEGILLFYYEKVLQLLDLKIYVDTDNDLRLARRIKRDIVERGRSVDNVLEQYQRTVKPSFEQFIQPSKRFADLIIPWNDNNPVAIDLLTQHISARLSHRVAAVAAAAAPKPEIAVDAAAASQTTPTQQTIFANISPRHETTGAQAPSSSNAASVIPLTMPNTTVVPGTLESHIASPQPFLNANASVLVQASPQLVVAEGGKLPAQPLATTTAITAASPTLSTTATASTARGVVNTSTHPRSSLVSAIKAIQDQHTKKHQGSKATRLFNENESCNVWTLTPSPNITALHTVLRDENTSTEDFRFAMNRLVRIICSEALSFLHYQAATVTTPTQVDFNGLQYDSRHVVCVSIVRAGEAFEPAVRDVIQDVAIGKIVIQSNTNNKADNAPHLYYAKLPDIQDPATKILLFDGVCSTGNATVMAVKVLLDRGARAENIIFCCVAAAPEGLYNICSTYPQVKVVSSSLEQGLDSQLFSTPGVGFIGDRYFGTLPTPGANSAAVTTKETESTVQ